MTFVRTVTSIILAASIAAGFLACKEEPTGNEQPIGQPSNLTVVTLELSTTAGVELQWKAPADSNELSAYRIWWQEIPNGAKDSAEVDTRRHTYSINGLKIGSRYQFSVASRLDNRFSAPATATWGGVFAPAAPADLGVTFKTMTDAHLAWRSANDTGLTGYRVSWREPGKADSTAIDVAASQASADIPELDRFTAYTFEVQSERNGLLSAGVVAHWAGTPPTPPPTGFRISPRGFSTLALAWSAPRDTGTFSYRVLWQSSTLSFDSGSVGTSDTIAVIENLSAANDYLFKVIAVRGGRSSEAVVTHGATAVRYAGGTLGKMRVYEENSSRGSALILDPERGGPNVVKLNHVPLSAVQLAFETRPGDPSSFDIGPAHAFSDLLNASEYDDSVYVSDSAYAAPSFDEWFYTGSLWETIAADGNGRIFTMPAERSDGRGEGFNVRLGSPGNYHFARIFINNVGGQLLQGSAPDRYIDLDISYQSATNVPYAKAARRMPTTANIVSRPRR